jgi:uncharacterized protein YggE
MTLTLTTRRIAGIAAATAILLGSYLLGASRDHASAAVTAATSTTGAVPTGISVSGTGKMTGIPDTLRVNLGVSVTGDTVSAALASANAKAEAVQKSLKGSGVAAKDLQTTGLNIQPNYISGNGGQAILRGYQVQESLTAVLRNLKTAGAAISAAAAAGGQATRIDGISLDLEDTSRLVTSARANAFTEARAKAEQYAHAAGVSLGKVMSIQETVQTPVPQPYPYAEAARASADLASVPIQAGSQELSVTVTVTFAID